MDFTSWVYVTFGIIAFGMAVVVLVVSRRDAALMGRVLGVAGFSLIAAAFWVVARSHMLGLTGRYLRDDYLAAKELLVTSMVVGLAGSIFVLGWLLDLLPADRRPPGFKGIRLWFLGISVSLAVTIFLALNNLIVRSNAVLVATLISAAIWLACLIVGGSRYVKEFLAARSNAEQSCHDTEGRAAETAKE